MSISCPSRTRIIAGVLCAATLSCKGAPASTQATPPPSAPVTARPTDPMPDPITAPSVVASAAQATSAAASTGARIWTFDTEAGGIPPIGFSLGRTGGGREGKWQVRAESDAPSPSNVLAQVDGDTTDYRFPVAVANEPVVRDVRLSVRCKPVSGKVDQACGLVFRFRDANNYYVARANALEGNVRLYHVVKGDRRQFAGWSGTVSTGHWHSLRVDTKGDHFEVYWDDKKVIDAHDTTFAEAGKVGVWTKADSVTYFDDLTASPN